MAEDKPTNLTLLNLNLWLYSVEKREPSYITLLVRMQTSTATMENSVEIS